MDAESFILVLILAFVMIPFAIVDLFRDPEETERQVTETEKSEWRHH